MAFLFPLTRNPHKLAQDLRKTNTLNGTGDESAVATGSDSDFQELSRRYQDCFQSDGAAISSSVISSVQPSSAPFRLLSTSKGPCIISLDRKPPKVEVKPPPVEDTDREAQTRHLMARESAVNVSTLLLEPRRMIPSKRNNRIAQHFQSDSTATSITIVRSRIASEQIFQQTVPITRGSAGSSPPERSLERRKRRRGRCCLVERPSPSFFRPPILTGYALGYENSRPIYRSGSSYIPDRMKQGTLAGWEPPQRGAAKQARRGRKRSAK